MPSIRSYGVAMSAFVHLRLHTEYALTDGTVRVEPPKRKGGGQGDTISPPINANRDAVSWRLRFWA